MSLSTRLDPFIAEVRQHWRIPGMAVAVVRRDGPLLVEAYGVSDVATSAPADIDTAFAVGSCSKAFTATLAAVLVDAAVIGWDDRIRKYLPSFSLYDPWISDQLTFRDVFANRTGLSRASIGEYGSDLTRAETLRRARSVQPIAQFRDQFTYCNVGFVVAAEAMAAAAGQSFDGLMNECLLKRLEFDRSRSTGATSNFAAPHYEIDGKVQTVPPMATDNLQGAIDRSMSAREAANWLRLHLEEGAREAHPVSAPQLRETHLLQTVRRDRTANDGYGLGWHVRNRRIQHDGAIRGFRANVWCDLDGDLAIFVATNLGAGFAHLAVTYRIIQEMRGETVTDWIKYFDDMADREIRERVARFEGERSSDPVSASRWSQDDFVGTYHHQGFGSLHIEPRDDHLWFRIDGLSGFDGPLMRYSGLSFEYQGDRDAMAWPAIAIPTAPRGERAQIRFQSTGNRIDRLRWQDWFGEAEFVQVMVRGHGFGRTIDMDPS
ncbi:hypothetical protein SSBR45G_57640 [Bradyrhizobium sp. SSBR45G]|uniref:serine hydrolase n=1 Tax=unclassified Bradyrhizobium TaxID=2631580 RepID=UPI0023428EB6|nr:MULTISPECIES: serine hydrolase [unclassified Bradyrhizobium]GLH80855.1 hypothetical protein SSBR45G_57640 [Bradyrhizobium sp. SSBR45G]GLH88327.1 hypothetical protein SSBR45R_57880 [Bradyrhizobium sp. SSBR45R]